MPRACRRSTSPRRTAAQPTVQPTRWWAQRRVQRLRGKRAAQHDGLRAAAEAHALQQVGEGAHDCTISGGGRLR